jgi:hypothetical protein
VRLEAEEERLQASGLMFLNLTLDTLTPDTSSERLWALDSEFENQKPGTGTRNSKAGMQ